MPAKNSSPDSFSVSSSSDAPGERLTVLLTGAGGRVGPSILGPFKERYDLRLLDKSPIANEPETILSDLSDITVLEQAMQGVDVVVHLAARSDEDDFMTELLQPNVVGLYNVMEAARRANVRRVVFASSVQASGSFPHEQKIEVTDVPRPTSVYGATKVWGETLGRWYYDRHKIEFVAVRIGWFQDYDSPRLTERGGARTIWLSPRDCGEIFVRAVETPDVGYAIVYGTSKTVRERLSLTALRDVLHYEPQDDVAVLYPLPPEAS